MGLLRIQQRGHGLLWLSELNLGYYHNPSLLLNAGWFEPVFNYMLIWIIYTEDLFIITDTIQIKVESECFPEKSGYILQLEPSEALSVFPGSPAPVLF